MVFPFSLKIREVDFFHQNSKINFRRSVSIVCADKFNSKCTFEHCFLQLFQLENSYGIRDKYGLFPHQAQVEL